MGWFPCECCGGCAHCTTGPPAELEAVIAGIVAKFPDKCDGHCPDYNDTYILGNLYSFSKGITDYCVWYYELITSITCPTPGTTDNYIVGVYTSGADLFIAGVAALPVSTDTNIPDPGGFEFHDPALTDNCAAWEDESIPGIGGGNCDDFSSATCLVTAQ